MVWRNARRSEEGSCFMEDLLLGKASGAGTCPWMILSGPDLATGRYHIRADGADLAGNPGCVFKAAG